MAMDGELTKEKIFRHYRDALTEREKESDFQPFNCMLRADIDALPQTECVDLPSGP
jgi:hypothetical protein